MTYKSAQVYTGSEWVDLAVSIPSVTQRTIGNIIGTLYTLLLVDAGKALIFSNSSSITVTIPLDSTTNFSIGQTFVLSPKGTGQITVAGAVGVTVSSLNGDLKSAGQYAELRLIKIAANEWLLSGDLTA